MKIPSLNSLTSKLTAAFLLVGLIGAALVAFLVHQSTQRQFEGLVLNQNRQILVNNLTNYYQETGTWDGLERVFRFQQAVPEPSQEGHWIVRRDLFVIADRSGIVVFGGGSRFEGQTLSRQDLDRGVPLEVEGEVVGWLLFLPTLDRWRPGTPEGDFLIGINRAIFTSALLATGIALITGGLLAFTLTRSLRELTAATADLAKGKLGRQVKVRSQDELGELAASFNTMSTALAHSVELRQKMTADIAHDLRTPLSVILGYTEALSDNKLEPTPEMFDVMHTEARHLSRLIDDLKTLSLAEAGELPLNFQLISPGELLRRIARANTIQVESKNLDLQVRIEEDLPDIRVDMERMTQVLGNLMDNALRYTPPGGMIHLSAGSVDGDVQIRVADSGVGIPPEDLPFIFERSFRGDKARRQAEGETGLGLAIAKSLVEAQAGMIEVESEPDQGTTFTIRFPAGSAPS